MSAGSYAAFLSGPIIDHGPSFCGIFQIVGCLQVDRFSLLVPTLWLASIDTISVDDHKSFFALTQSKLISALPGSLPIYRTRSWFSLLK